VHAPAHSRAGVGYIARVHSVRRRVLVLAAALSCGVAGCGGGSDYANKPRPATPINVTAAISTKKVSVSPKTFGAGPIVVVISNQTGTPQTLTLQTQELGGSKPGLKVSSDPIGPRDTGTMKVDVREGSYELSARGGVKAASVEVSKDRKSAQDELLEP
jgi:hypothetical protein